MSRSVFAVTLQQDHSDFHLKAGSPAKAELPSPAELSSLSWPPGGRVTMTLGFLIFLVFGCETVFLCAVQLTTYSLICFEMEVS